jgi:multidrug transporter EmrE-like cation transporter
MGTKGSTIEMIALTWITIASLVEVPALTLLRMGGIVNISLASIIFALGVVPVLSIALQYEGIGLVNFLWNILSTIIMLVIGIFFFKEKVSVLQLIGVLLSLLGMSLVVVSRE